MQVDVLVIGQGIAGTMLSWELENESLSFVVIDAGNDDSASSVAAGLLNPVTGRRYVEAWMYDELVDFARLRYQILGDDLSTRLMHQKTIIDFFPTPQMRNSFVDRIDEKARYLHTYPDQNKFNPHFNYDFGCGAIDPAYLVHVPLLLAAWRKKLLENKKLIESTIDATALIISNNNVCYGDIKADKIIFCDGIASATNPFFSLLPFSANKGEALIIECKGLPHDLIFKKGMMLCPLATENIFWLGSNYLWSYEDDKPSKAFYEQADNLLKNWLRLPYKILFHKAAIRPATLERRPFVGFHPLHPAVGILNGLGTKGTSLAPYFAHQLVQHICYQKPITPEADVKRFSRILSK